MLSRNYHYKPVFALLLASLLVSMGSDSAHAQGIAWRHDLASAQAEANQANKLVLIHFWTPTCGPCKRLEKLVFNSPGVGASIARDYVPVKINANASPAIANKYHITRVPTDVVVTSSGHLVKAFVSPATPMAYVGLMGDVASTYRSQNTGFDRVASNAPFSQTPANQRLQPAGQPLNSAYSGLAAAATQPVAQLAAQQAAPSSAPKQTPYDRYAAAAPQPPVDRYAMQEPTTPVVAAPVVARGVPAVVNNPAVSQPVANQAAPPVTPAPVVPVVNPHYTAPAASVTPPAPVTPQAAAPTPQPQSDLTSQLPPGSPALGFDGFCPVTMKNEWRWAKGDAKWGAIHRGRTYLFTGQAARDTFLSEPDKFSPALSGADPVLAVETQQSVPGTREFAVEYEGQFYLFSSEQSLKKFWSNADGYAKGAERVAGKLRTDGVIRR